MARGGAPAAGPTSGENGWSITELVIVLALISLMASMTVPVTASALDARKARDAAGFIASRLRQARQQAVHKTRSVGLVFQLETTARWTFRMCVDGNRNGIRKADVASGRDVCSEGPYDVQALFSGVSIAVDPGLAGPDGSVASANPVRFGTSLIASFSSDGNCSAGTIYLRSVNGAQYAIRVGSVGGRTRILRFDSGTGRWTDG